MAKSEKLCCQCVVLEGPRLLKKWTVQCGKNEYSYTLTIFLKIIFTKLHSSIFYFYTGAHETYEFLKLEIRLHTH